MRDIPNDDKPGFVAEKRERCFTCYRLILPGQICHLTIEFEALCKDCGPLPQNCPASAARPGSKASG